MAKHLVNGFISAVVSSFLALNSFTVSAQHIENGQVVYFDLNVATLSAASTNTIDALLATNKINNSQQLLLYGYADYLGTREHNDSLSTERAMNVRNYLLAKGIPGKNITVCVGKGQIIRAPKAGHTGYAQDRKVEIITDAGKIKKLTCTVLEKYEPLKWSKNVSNLKVHARQDKTKRKMTDKTITVSLPNGDKYIGEINASGEKQSNGMYMWANGDTYQGDFKNDKKDGHGVYTWSNGDMLVGLWVANEIQNGNLTIPYDGVLYHSDSNHTHSANTYKGVLTYNGQFSKHMLNGLGEAKWPNGDRYNGDWKNDMMDGHGQYQWASGDKYIGEWKNNKMNGHGQLFGASGGIQQGTWENDQYKGK